MIEFSTGVIFLMSSLYGSSHANTQLAMTAKTANIMGDTVRKTELVALKETENKKDGKYKDINSVEAYLRKEFADAPILIEIARCESHLTQFHPDGKVVRGIQNSQDIGVMQINEKYHGETAKNLGYDIYTTEGNAAFGMYLYKRYGTSPWNYSSKCWGMHDIAQN